MNIKNTAHRHAIERLASFSKECHAFDPIHVFGGYVRDIYMGNVPKDLDIGITGDIEEFADAFENYLGDDCRGRFSNSRNEDVVTIVVSTPYGNVEIDATINRGYPLPDTDTLDFTINAMAIDIHDCLKDDVEKHIIAPGNGMDSIAKRVLLQTSINSIPKDPIRILRGIRTAVQYGLTIDIATHKSMEHHLDMLAEMPGERVEVELMRTLKLDSEWIWIYKDIGILDALLPEIAACEGIEQPDKYHEFDVLGHSVAAMDAVKSFFDGTPPVPINKQLSDYFNHEVGDGYTRKDLLVLGTLLHDVGKPLTKGMNDDGRINFLGHEKVGADIVRGIAKRMKFSNATKSLLVRMVRYHMRPWSLIQSGKPTHRALMRFRRDAGDADIAILFLHMADLIGARGSMLSHDELFKHRRFVLDVLSMADEQQKIIEAPRLLTGFDLINMGIPQGPEIGRLLSILEDSTICGEVGTRKEAIDLVKKNTELCDTIAIEDRDAQKYAHWHYLS